MSVPSICCIPLARHESELANVTAVLEEARIVIEKDGEGLVAGEQATDVRGCVLREDGRGGRERRGAVARRW